jgi:hypothetical protein
VSREKDESHGRHRPASRKKRILLCIIGELLVAGGIGPAACSKKQETAPAPPPATQYEHAIGVNATYFFSGSPANGTYTVKMLSNNQTYSSIIGQKISLAKTTTQSEPCDILVRPVAWRCQ